MMPVLRPVLAAMALLAVVLSPAAAHAAPRADAPLDLTSQVTDRAGVLDDTAALQRDLDKVRADGGPQLFVAYVDSFDSLDGESWAARTFQDSGLGGNDVLLAVAVKDRRYGTYATGESGLTAADDQRVRSQDIEPALARSDWDGAARAAAEGYRDAASGSRGGSGLGLGLGFLTFPLLCLLIPFLPVFLLFRSARRRTRLVPPDPVRAPAPAGPLEPRLDELRSRARAALVAMDDALRSSAEELSFAEAQFGREATRRFRDVLDRARQSAAEAFRLQREVEEVGVRRLGEQGVRERYRQVLALAEQVDRQLEAEADEFDRLRNLEATVPDFLGDLGARVREVRRRLPVAEQELAGLSATYPPAALQSVTGAVEQARRLLDSADELLASGWGHLARRPGQPAAPATSEGENRPAAVAAARAAEEAIGQADRLLASVAEARTELATATERLGPALASLQSDVDDAARLRADDPVTRAALEAAHAALRQGAAARTGGDPLAALRTLAKAELDLDNALERYREQEGRRQRHQELLSRRFTEVRSLLQDVDRFLTQYRGAIGGEARMLLSEAVREYDGARDRASNDATEAAAALDRSEDLAERAYEQAQDDLSGWGQGGYGWSGGAVGGSGLGLGAAVLGGILAGGLIGGIGRGGGWGGGGFGGGWGGGGFGGGGDFGGGDVGGGGAF